MSAARRRRARWETWDDELLLDLRFCDLGLELDRSPLARPIAAF